MDEWNGQAHLVAMLDNVISSLRDLDPDEVAARREAEDYTAQFVWVTIENADYMVVVDGHHSIAAAMEDGVAVEWEEVSGEMADHAESDPEGFLEEHRMDSDYFYLDSGLPVW